MSVPPSKQPDPWLRGPVPGVPALLQPFAFAFVAVREDIERAVVGITADELWARPGDAASLGFHLAHLSGSTDRLLTYARGEALSEAQRAYLVRERGIAEARPSLEELLVSLNQTLDRSLEQLASTNEATLTEPRAVGKTPNASTVLGLLFHAAEHAARHAGQIVTTAKVVRASSAPAESQAKA
jgi:uncharacterized damage-inducible protein DinB